jgi:hypothetical protein
MSSSNTPQKVVPGWFSDIIMSNFDTYVNELSKQVENTGKEKYLEPYDNFMDDFDEIIKMNETIRVQGRYQLNDDGSKKIDAKTGKVIFHQELDDEKVINRLNAMQANLQKIIQVSTNTFDRNSSDGVMISSLISLCDDIKKFHVNTKQALEMKYLKDYFEENKNAHPELLQDNTIKNDLWFDKNQMDKLTYSFAVVKDHFAKTPESQAALNGIYASIKSFNSIDTLNKVSGPYVHDENGSIQVNKMGVEFLPALDDPNISGSINVMVQQAIELAKSVSPKTPVSLALQQIINTEIFEKHREKKQQAEQDFFKKFYLQTAPNAQPEISIASTTRSYSVSSSELSSPLISPSASPHASRTVSITDFSGLLHPELVAPTIETAKPEVQTPIVDTKAFSLLRYTLIGIGIALGAAAIATGFGAVIGIALLTVSVGFAVAEIARANAKKGDYSSLNSEDILKKEAAAVDIDLGITSTSKLSNGLGLTKEHLKKSLNSIEASPVVSKEVSKQEIQPTISPSEPTPIQTPRPPR